jgi:hypothetical protein
MRKTAVIWFTGESQLFELETVAAPWSSLADLPPHANLSTLPLPGWRNGRRLGLKILRGFFLMWVRLPPRAPFIPRPFLTTRARKTFREGSPGHLFVQNSVLDTFFVPAIKSFTCSTVGSDVLLWSHKFRISVRC